MSDSCVRLGGIAPSVWRRPYMIGFLTMLITQIARRAPTGDLTGEELGRVQIDAWTALTGMPDDRIGEDICLLSASADADFMHGCRNAFDLADLLTARQASPRLDPDDVAGLLLLPERALPPTEPGWSAFVPDAPIASRSLDAETLRLWELHFEAHVRLDTNAADGFASPIWD